MKRVSVEVLILVFLLEIINYSGNLFGINIIIDYFGFNHKIILLNQDNFQKNGHWNMEITPEMLNELGEIPVCDSKQGEASFQDGDGHCELTLNPYIHLLQTLFYDLKKLDLTIEYFYSLIHFSTNQYSFIYPLLIEKPPKFV